MFRKIKETHYPPSSPTFIWDGTCGFCRYWKEHIELLTPSSIHYKPYQDVADRFSYIPLKEFKKASRLIETNGKIYSGPNSIYRLYWWAGRKKFFEYYEKYPIFQRISDHIYNHIAKHRSIYFRFTHLLLGKNPKKFHHYWILYILILFTLIFAL